MGDTMERTALKYLKEWLYSDDRLPLVIRGARQVGKTWLVSHLAKVEKKQLIEVNLEKRPELASSFSSNDPILIMRSLSIALNMAGPIDPAKSILFIDEIQAAPEVFAKLRWFAEDMPELPVIAAGSLLEFVLGTYHMSMPVGRITYMYLEPLSFEEFLLATGHSGLLRGVKEFEWRYGIDDYSHKKYIELFKEYVIVGGMPAAVANWVRKHSLQDISRIHEGIMKTYKADFSKYGGRISSRLLEKVIERVPRDLGEKFVFTRVSDQDRIPTIKTALNLLCQAKVCHKVQAVSANGVPLKAEILEKFIKLIFLDVGLCSAALELSLVDIGDLQELILINSGGIAEQVVGQLLRTLFPLYKEPELYYWLNLKRGASAEIDYVIQHGRTVVPVEVKAGTTGRLRSLHRFMSLKKLPLAVRINSAPPQISEVDTKDREGQPITYQLRSIPFYLIGELHRLLD